MIVEKEVFCYRSIPHNSRFPYLARSTFETDIEPTQPLGPGGIKSSNNLEERRPLKVALLALAARTNRGEIANTNEKDRASELVRQLESYNPSREPALNELSLGRWELVFASTQLFRSSPFFMAARAVCKEGNEAANFNQFCDLHRDALAFTQIGKVLQIVTEDKLISEFETKVAVIPGAPIVIRGTICSESDIISRTEDSWELYMVRNVLICLCIHLLTNLLLDPTEKITILINPSHYHLSIVPFVL